MPVRKAESSRRRLTSRRFAPIESQLCLESSRSRSTSRRFRTSPSRITLQRRDVTLSGESQRKLVAKPSRTVAMQTEIATISLLIATIQRHIATVRHNFATIQRDFATLRDDLEERKKTSRRFGGASRRIRDIGPAAARLRDDFRLGQTVARENRREVDPHRDGANELRDDFARSVAKWGVRPTPALPRPGPSGGSPPPPSPCPGRRPTPGASGSSARPQRCWAWAGP